MNAIMEITTKTALNILAKHTLLAAESYQQFDADDMVNVTLIFQHVIQNLMWDHHNELKIPFEARCEIGGEFGKNMRQTILLATGIDTVQAATDYVAGRTR